MVYQNKWGNDADKEYLLILERIKRNKKDRITSLQKEEERLPEKIKKEIIAIENIKNDVDNNSDLSGSILNKSKKTRKNTRQEIDLSLLEDNNISKPITDDAINDHGEMNSFEIGANWFRDAHPFQN